MKTGPILITGSAGLIGSAVGQRLRSHGYDVEGLDTRSRDEHQRVDVCDITSHCSLLNNAQGVIHLAAVSRVIDAQLDPVSCQRVNVDGTRRLLEAIASLRSKPWFIYASSREVYGEQRSMPVAETASLQPLNVYAKSKLVAESLTAEARRSGINSAIVRFSNVYGSAKDHETRVVPAFIRRALNGQPLFVEGENNTFDFTFVEDVSAGVVTLVNQLSSGLTQPNPIHLVTGRETSLKTLASLIIRKTNSTSSIVQMPSRTFDVSRFCGNSAFAKEALGWAAATTIEDGLARMIQDCRVFRGATSVI